MGVFSLVDLLPHLQLEKLAVAGFRICLYRYLLAERFMLSLRDEWKGVATGIILQRRS